MRGSSALSSVAGNANHNYTTGKRLTTMYMGVAKAPVCNCALTVSHLRDDSRRYPYTLRASAVPPACSQHNFYVSLSASTIPC